MQCGTLNLKPYQSQAKLSLTVPVSASCIMLEFASFWQNLSASSAEVLQCPRCSQIVSHPQGYCRYCKENAYQCRHCRSASGSCTIYFALCAPCSMLCALRLVLRTLHSALYSPHSALCALCTLCSTLRTLDSSQCCLADCSRLWSHQYKCRSKRHSLLFEQQSVLHLEALIMHMWKT